jgi:predicted DNA-binding protein
MQIKTRCIGTRLTPEIEELLQKVVQAQGLTPSEFLRQLVLEKLEELSLISTKIEKIKEQVRNGH